MKILAKGTVTGGYWGYGRKWPRDTSIEVDVTEEEYAKIAADEHIVAVPVPDSAFGQSKGDFKQKVK